MAVRVGAGLVGDVRLGSARLSKVMVGTSEVWSAFTPWSASGSYPSTFVAGTTVFGSVTVPYAMVADVSFSAAGALSANRYVVAGPYIAGGEYVSGTSTYTRRMALPAGTLQFCTTTSSQSMSGSWTVTAVNTTAVDMSKADVYAGYAIALNVDVVVATWRAPVAATVNVTFNGDWNLNGTGYGRYLKIAAGTVGNIVATSAEGAETVSASGVSLAAGDPVYFIGAATTSTTTRRLFAPGSGWSVTLV